MPSTARKPPTFGRRLREWRVRRRMSQLSFALEAEISQKHLSFLESGRSAPSRDMVIRLAERLDVPLRERNALLLSAGFAPPYQHRPYDDPALAPARAAIDMVLKGHEPYPALAVDRHWTMIAANGVAGAFLAGVVGPKLLEPPVNVLRLSLHPDGLAPRIVNLPVWRHHLLDRLRHQIAATADDELGRLLAELRAYPSPDASDFAEGDPTPQSDVFVPLVLRLPDGVLSFFSTITVFGTPIEVTLSEIAVEAFFPADEATRRRLQALIGTAVMSS
ncbi:MAG: helix-turn-helix transcriptional regulator [Alphaproteobacteria bacterium]|nr:helix-turn-helix transcriptional regulator [Alphaproteobacteria bacterium]